MTNAGNLVVSGKITKRIILVIAGALGVIALVSYCTHVPSDVPELNGRNVSEAVSIIRGCTPSCARYIEVVKIEKTDDGSATAQLEFSSYPINVIDVDYSYYGKGRADIRKRMAFGFSKRLGDTETHADLDVEKEPEAIQVQWLFVSTNPV